ncbi:MAG: tyrosine-type recombinase/integrase [Holosporales bacterium]|nr:tyrosine-type recombinase/integrase [Holosporales bacterium]
MSLLHSQSRAKATYLAYDGDLTCFLEFYARYTGEEATLEGVLKIEPKDWRAWFSHQRNEGLDVKTLSRRLSALKSFFRFLVEQGYIEDHPIFSARNPRVPKALPRPAAYNDILLLMNSCSLLPGPDWVHKRDKALIFLIYSVGLRISEALSLNCEDISNTDFLTIKGKRNKIRQVPFMSGAKKIIFEYKNACPDASCCTAPSSSNAASNNAPAVVPNNAPTAASNNFLTNAAPNNAPAIQLVPQKSEGPARDLLPSRPLFIGEKGTRLLAQVFEARVRKLRRLLGLPETFTPHALRHSCATHLMATSEDLRGIQELLGHASLSTTQIYTDINNEQLRSTVTRAHPRAAGGGGTS